MVTALHVVVLERTPFGEADRLITVYSLERGRERLLAKGIRRPLSQLKSALELFTFSSILVTDSRSLPTIVEAKSIDGFMTLRSDISRVMAAHHIAEVILRTTVERDANPEAFSLLTTTFAALDRSPSFELLVESFRLKQLDAIGLSPELTRCVRCQGTLDPAELWFSAGSEGVECATCRTADAVPLTANVLKALRFLLAAEYGDAARLRLPDADRQVVRDATRRLIEAAAQRELKSTRFLER